MVSTYNQALAQKKIYVVVSDSGTNISKMLRGFTKAKYNHVSLSLKEDLSEMYSFARRWKYYAFYGGFVKETPYTGVFGLRPNAEIAVLTFEVTEKQYEDVQAHIEKMYENRKKYKYSWLGLFMMLFRKRLKRKRHYICSEFVEETLVKFGVVRESDFPVAVRPNEFLHIFGERKTYEGKYRAYAIALPDKEKQAV